MDDLPWVAAVVAGCAALVAVITIPVVTVVHAGTERHNACVAAGGSYVHVSNTGYFECQNGSN